MSSFLMPIFFQAHFRGLLVRRKLVEQVRREYLNICQSLEEGFDTSRVVWKTNSTLCSPKWADSRCSKQNNHVLFQKDISHKPSTALSTQKEEGFQVKPPDEIHQPVLDIQTHSGDDNSLGSVSDLSVSLSSVSEESLTSESCRFDPPVAAGDVHGNVKNGAVAESEDVSNLEDGIHVPLNVNVAPEAEISVGREVIREHSHPEGGSGKLKSELEHEMLELELRNEDSKSGMCDEHLRSKSHPLPGVIQSTGLEMTSVATSVTTPVTSVTSSSLQPTDQDSPRPLETPCSDGNLHNTTMLPTTTPEQMFFSEICSVISQSEKEGKSYEELKAQLVLELGWIKQAIRSRQQVVMFHTVMSPPVYQEHGTAPHPKVKEERDINPSINTCTLVGLVDIKYTPSLAPW